MAGNNTPNSQVEQTTNSPEKKSNSLRSALAGLALSVATSGAIADVRADVESNLNLEQNHTVTFVGGGTAELYKEGGKFYIKNGDSKNGSDVFTGTITIGNKVFLVKPNETDKKAVVLSEYKSKIGLDYSKYGDMATNFQAGEVEYLVSVEEIIMSKPEKIRDILRNAFYKKWENTLNDVYDGNGEIKGAYLDLLLEKTPNMVSSWSSLNGQYRLLYENQQATKDLETAKMFSGK